MFDAMQPASVLEHFEHMRHLAQKLSHCRDHKVAACAVVIKDDMVVWSSPFNFNTPAASCSYGKRCAKFDGKPCEALHAEMSLHNWLMFTVSRPVFTHIMVTYQPCENCARALRAWDKPILFYEKSNKPVPQGCEWYYPGPQQASQRTWEDLWSDIRAYHKALGSPDLSPAGLEPDNKYKQVREASLALFMEVAELVDTQQWKPWRKARVFERQHFIEEMADICFFMSSLMELHNIPEAELRQAIADKLATNLNRLTEGYHQ